MKPPPFAYAAPTTVDEVLDLLAEHGDEAKIIAGGQSLVPMLAMRLARPSVLVDVTRVDSLGGIEERNGHVVFGATARERDGRALDGRGRAHAGAGRVPPVHRPRLDPQPGHDRRQHRPRRRGRRAPRRRRADRRRAARAQQGRRAGRGRRRLLPRPLQHRPRRRGLPGRGPGADHGRRAPGGRSRRSPVATATSRSSGRGRWWPSTTSATIRAARVSLFGVADRPVRVREVEAGLAGATASVDTIAGAAADIVRELDPSSDGQGSAAYRRQLAGVVVRKALTAAAERAGGPA